MLSFTEENLRCPFAHRNTVLYRIRRIRDDFNIPLDDPAVHADLLLGSSLLLFEEKGPDFFVNIKIIERNSYYEGKQKVVKRST